MRGRKIGEQRKKASSGCVIVKQQVCRCAWRLAPSLVSYQDFRGVTIYGIYPGTKTETALVEPPTLIFYSWSKNNHHDHTFIIHGAAEYNRNSRCFSLPNIFDSKVPR